MMTTNSLDAVFCDEFEANSLPASSASALVAILDRTPELQKIRVALAAEVISVNSIRNRMEQAFEDFRPGHWFPHTPGIAALLLGMCHSYDPDAERCLDLVSQLRHPELRIIRDTAKICLVRMSHNPRETGRLHDFELLKFNPDPDSLNLAQMSEQFDDRNITTGELRHA